MKKCILVFGLFVLIVGLTGVAGAVTYKDVYNAKGILIGATTSPSTALYRVAWTFDIGQYGFRPSAQQITSASITLRLRDSNNDPCSLQLKFDELAVGRNPFSFEVSIGGKTVVVSGFLRLGEGGKIKVVLKGLPYGYHFRKAILRARAPLGVPEPSTVILLGSGLLGLGIWRWIRSRKRGRSPLLKVFTS